MKECVACAERKCDNGGTDVCAVLVVRAVGETQGRLYGLVVE